MSDLLPKPQTARTTGLGPKAQKLQAMREKAAQAKTGGKPVDGVSTGSVKAKNLAAGAKKTSFQRKAV